MTKLFLDLEQNGIDAGDIRQLLHMNPSQEDVQGVVSSLDYWCCKWRERRFPSPLRIVYCLDHLKMIALPFLDTTISQDKFWGIAIENLIIYKKAILQVAIYEASGVLRKCSYDTYQNWPAEGNSKYGIRLPTIDEVHQIAENYKTLQATVHFLRRYGIDFDAWTYSSYWVQSLEPPYPMGIGVVEANHTFVRQQATEAKQCMVRPVLNLFEEEKDEGLDFIGRLDRYCLPDKKSEKLAKKLAKK